MDPGDLAASRRRRTLPRARRRRDPNKGARGDELAGFYWTRPQEIGKRRPARVAGSQPEEGSRRLVGSAEGLWQLSDGPSRLRRWTVCWAHGPVVCWAPLAFGK